MIKKRIGMYSSMASFLSALVFAISILFGILIFNHAIGIIGIYFSGMVIAVSFILMVYSYFLCASVEEKSLLFFSLIISLIYGIKNIVSYNVQFSALVFSGNPVSGNFLLDYSQFELFFNDNMFGYVLMSIALIFAGLSLKVKNGREKLLQKLMHTHSVFGLFFVLNLLFMLLNRIFTHFIKAGLILMVLWCVYFSLLSFLSFSYFRHKN